MKLYILCLITLANNILFVSSNTIPPTKSNQDNYIYYQKFINNNKNSPIPSPIKLKSYNDKSISIIKNVSQNNTQKIEKIEKIKEEIKEEIKQEEIKEEEEKIEKKVQKTSKLNMVIFIFFEIFIISILLLACLQNANKILYKEKEKSKEKDYSLPTYIKKNLDNNQIDNCYRRISSHENLYSVA